MAAFFKISASAGIVVCAEHVYAPGRVHPGAPRLSACWTRDAEGRLTRAWCEAPLAIAA